MTPQGSRGQHILHIAISVDRWVGTRRKTTFTVKTSCARRDIKLVTVKQYQGVVVYTMYTFSLPSLPLETVAVKLS